MALNPDEVTDRQKALISQVKAGRIEEDLTDTTESLLTLARHGLLEAWHDAEGWHFSAPTEPEPPAPDPAQDEPGEE